MRVMVRKSKELRLCLIPAHDFRREYKKTSLIYTDTVGEFGFPGYSYHVYQNSSKCVLIATKTRIETMRNPEKLRKILEKEHIDIDEITDSNMMLVARE